MAHRHDREWATLTLCVVLLGLVMVQRVHGRCGDTRQQLQFAHGRVAPRASNEGAGNRSGSPVLVAVPGLPDCASPSHHANQDTHDAPHDQAYMLGAGAGAGVLLLLAVVGVAAMCCTHGSSNKTRKGRSRSEQKPLLPGHGHGSANINSAPGTSGMVYVALPP